MLKEHSLIYFIFVGILIAIFIFLLIALLIMAYRIKFKLLNILWPITILKFCLPFFSFTIFGQCFSILTTIFQCNENNSYISSSLECRSGVWFSILAPLTIIALFFQFFIALITINLYLRPIFINNISDILKKTDSFSDNIYLFTKIGLNLLFMIDKNNEDSHLVILFFAIIFTSINAFYSLYYQNRVNNTFQILNNIFSLILFAAFICLIIGKIFAQVEFKGSIFLFFCCIAIIILYIIFYKNREIKYISIDYKEILNPVEYINYIFNFYNIIHNKRNTRNYYTILKSLSSKIEETCIIPDCPLKKYIENLNEGKECLFLLYQFCEKLFEFGISRFSDDVCLKIHYSIYLISDMNYQKKALIILNEINNHNNISFQNNFFIYRTLKLSEKWNFSLVNKNNSNYRYRQDTQEFRALIKKLALLYYDFLCLLGNHSNNVENFNKIHKIGMEIIKNNPKIEEIYKKIINTQTNNLEIIKIYSEFVEDILYDEEKLEKCQKNSNKTFSSSLEIPEKDFSNYNIEILNTNGNLAYMIISAQKENFGKILDISLITLKLFGYTKEEIKGQHINILIPKIFQKVHDLILLKKNEQHRLKFFDGLNKRKKYFPEFFKKELFAISKMKFLIELIANIFFVKTEENNLVYIFKIENYTPIKTDLIKNSNNISKYCVLTDENFLIQNFTPNCIEFLNLKYSQINSNDSIINYIQQFQEDYLIAINDEAISKYTHITKDDIITEDKEESEIFKSKIPTFIRKKIKNDLFSKKYSKECTITWRIKYNTNIDTTKIIEYIKSTHSKQIKSELYQNDTKKLHMKIRKIILNEQFLGYYFIFSKGIVKDNDNITFTHEKTKIKDKKKSIIKIKKYQCNFKNKIERKNMFSSMVLKSSKEGSPEKNEININFMEAKSIDKSPKVNFINVDKNSKINTASSIFNTKEKNIINDLLNDEGDNNSTKIEGDYIPEYLPNLLLDLEDLSFTKSYNNIHQDDYLNTLQTQAYQKIKESQEQQLKFANSESSYNDSEEESYDNFAESSHIPSFEEEKEKNVVCKDSSKIDSKDMTINTSSGITDHNITANNIKKNPRKSLVNNFYKVNLNNIHLYIYDFFKEEAVKESEKYICSKMDNLISNFSNSVEPIYFEKDEKFSYQKLINAKSKKNLKMKDLEENESISTSTFNDINDKINEEKLIRKKLYEALNKNSDEPPIKKLKIFSFFYYFVLIIFGIIMIILDLDSLSKINEKLSGYKYASLVQYYSQFSVYYLREKTLINFKYTGIWGGEYTEYPAIDKEEYQNLTSRELMRLLKESQSSLELMFSSSLDSNKYSSEILYDYKVKIKLSNSPLLEKQYNIIMSLMHYSSSFNNLASTQFLFPLEQNHPDLIHYIYNNFNGYKYVLIILAELYKSELDRILNEITLYSIIFCTIISIFCVFQYIFILKYFLNAMTTRGNYMKLFFGIDEYIIKNLINNCENFINKLKSSKEQKYFEDKILNESFEEDEQDKINIDNNQKTKKKSLTFNSKLNRDNKNKTPKTSIIFIIIFGLFNLISFSYFIYNWNYMINKSKKSISIHNFWDRMKHYHLTIIESFNVYREFLFDNQSITNDTYSFKYLDKIEKESLLYLGKDSKFLIENVFKLLPKSQIKGFNSLLSKTLCMFYINDYFDSCFDCENKVGLIATYGFEDFSYNFLEEIKIAKNIVKYKLQNEIVLGNLTTYDSREYYKLQEIIGSSSYEIFEDEPVNHNYSIIFRLDLFNNQTIHKRLNAIFFTIVMPYIEAISKFLFNAMNIDGIDKNLISLNILFYIIVTIVFLVYFIPIINYINSNIYKTKNMLSIIPLNILSTQNGVLKLLNISHEN